MSSDHRPKSLGENVQRFLRTKYPHKTAACVAADTGCNIKQVGKWLEGASAPGGDAMLALVEAYGPEFLAAVLPRQFDWVSEACDRREMAELRAQQARVNARIEARLAEMSSL